MSGILANDKAAMAKEAGKLKKLLQAIKKFLATEFLWVLFVAIIALPLALFFNYIIKSYLPEVAVCFQQFLNGKPLFIASYILSIAGVYFTRAVVGALNTLAKKPEN